MTAPPSPADTEVVALDAAAAAPPSDGQPQELTIRLVTDTDRAAATDRQAAYEVGPHSPGPGRRGGRQRLQSPRRRRRPRGKGTGARPPYTPPLPWIPLRVGWLHLQEVRLTFTRPCCSRRPPPLNLHA
jgi:hypothetical protein